MICTGLLFKRKAITNDVCHVIHLLDTQYIHYGHERYIVGLDIFTVENFHGFAIYVNRFTCDSVK